MNKICIVSSDSLFAGDLAQQILREVPETEILSADYGTKCRYASD